MEDTSDFGLVNPAPRCLISAATRSPWPRAFACLPIATSTKSPKLSWGRPKPMCSLSAAMGTCIPLSAPARSWERRRQPDCSTRSLQLWPTATTGGWCCGTSSYGNSSLRMKKGKSHSWPDLCTTTKGCSELPAWKMGMNNFLLPIVQVWIQNKGRWLFVVFFSVLGKQIASYSNSAIKCSKDRCQDV